jgi:hemolysin activation/secretion protein
LGLAAAPCAQAEAQTPREPAPACAEDACFTLLGVTIDGVTAFAQADLAPLYTSYLARQVGTADLTRIAQSITDRYRAQGFFLARAYVPEQAGDGIARIEVLEGRIGEVVIEGDAARQVAPYLRGLESMPVATLAEMDRRLALAADVSGVSLRSRMEPDPADPGSHRLVVTAELRRTEAWAAMDNRANEAAGPLQAYGRVAANSVLRARDQLGLAILTTPQDIGEFSMAEITYAYAFENGARVRTALLASHADGGATPADTGGESYSAFVGYETPLVRRRGQGLWLGAAFDLRHLENDWLGGGGYVDELRVARASLRGFLDDGGQATTLFFQASYGLDLLGASDASPTRRSRADADAGFVKLDLFASHYADIGEHFGLYGALAAQWSGEPLLQSEEFAAGGLPFGRGYSYGEISGDSGMALSVEFRAGLDPNLDPVSFLQGYLFADAAEIWDEAGGAVSLASVGAGMRVTLYDRVTAGLEFARPLDIAPAEEGNRDWRQFFSLSAEY